LLGKIGDVEIISNFPNNLNIWIFAKQRLQASGLIFADHRRLSDHAIVMHGKYSASVALMAIYPSLLTYPNVAVIGG
jgi:hypothetical protein